jgi:hypothetical protein
MKRPAIFGSSCVALSALASLLAACRGGSVGGDASPANLPATADSNWADVPLLPRTSVGARPRFSVDGAVVEDFASQLRWQRATAGAPVDLRTAEQYCAELPSGPWRLPVRLELLTLLDLARGAAPFSDVEAFGLVPEGAFWSSTPVEGAADRRWTVAFSTGATAPNAAPRAHVRCVKGALASAPTPRFRHTGKLVLDQASNLLWTAAPLPEAAKHGQARALCQKLVVDGVRGFHLPGRVELETLIDVRRRAPALDGEAFEVRPHELAWSANGALGANRAWLLALDTGEPREDDGDELHTVRCVKPM